MSEWIVAPIKGLIEPSVAPEYFVNGPGAIERIGSNLRFYLYARQLPLEAGSTEPNLIVQCKITRPMFGIHSTAIQLLHCLDTEQMPDMPRGYSAPRLVR